MHRGHGTAGISARDAACMEALNNADDSCDAAAGMAAASLVKLYKPAMML